VRGDAMASSGMIRSPPEARPRAGPVRNSIPPWRAAEFSTIQDASQSNITNYGSDYPFQHRHCEERSDAAIHGGRPRVGTMDCRATLAMTVARLLDARRRVGRRPK